MKKVRNYADTVEVNYYTFSSQATTPEEAIDTLTLETTGPYLGTDDFSSYGDEFLGDTIMYLSAHWDEAEEMSEAEVDDRISILAEAWGVMLGDLSYLK